MNKTSSRVLRIKRIRRETSQACCLFFDVAYADFPHRAGQFITVEVSLNGQLVRRSYSLHTFPGVDDHPGILVKRVSGGLLSNHINDHWRAGDRMRITPPAGNFTLPTPPPPHLFLLAGGSGITPLLALSKEFFAVSPRGTVHLLYVNRSQETLLFGEEIGKMAHKYGKRFRVSYWFSLPAGNPPQRERRRIQAGDVAQMVKEITGKACLYTHYFVCGPAGLAKTTQIALSSLAVPHVHKESFSTGETTQAKAVRDDEVPVQVHLHGTAHTFAVPSSESVLDSGLRHDLAMPYSCMGGICTACKGRLTRGKVCMTTSEGLTEEEKEAGFVLCCQSHPLTDDVVIHID